MTLKERDPLVMRLTKVLLNLKDYRLRYDAWLLIESLMLEWRDLNKDAITEKVSILEEKV